MSLITGIALPNVKRFFRPDPGYIMFDVDLAGADAQVVAWEADDESLKKAFRDYAAGTGPKIHCINAKDIFGDLAGPDGKRDPFYSRAKAGVHLCVADGHEALTPYGWIPVQTISENTLILVCQADGSEARWEMPRSWYHADYEGEMLRISGASYEQLVTPNHKMPYFVDSTVRQCQAKDLPRSAKLPKTVSYSGPSKVDQFQLRLLAAFHADGSIKNKQVHFRFKKERKIERLYWILGQLSMTYYVREYKDGVTNIVLPGGTFYTDWLIAQGKAPTLDMLQYSAEGLDAYIEELPLWDGCQGKTSQNFSTALAGTADVIHTLLHLRRHSGTHHVRGERDHSVQINNRPLSYIQERKLIDYSGAVHCPTVSTGFWFTRYKGRCAVTGNTNYNGQAKTCATALNISIPAAEAFQARWFRLHPGIKKWHERIWNELLTTRTVSNKFGFTRTFFGRITTKTLGEALAWIPQCVPLDHEVLTPDGWKMISLIQPADRIAIWKEDHSISFECPSAWTFGKGEVAFQENLNYYCTDLHRIPYYNAGRGELQVKTAADLPSGARIPCTGFYEGRSTLSEADIAYIVAFQADGCYDKKRDAVSFEFQKTRKILRMRTILQTLEIPFSENIVRRGATVFYIPKGQHQLSIAFKVFGSWLLELSAKSLDFFLQELEFWDGWRSPQGELWYSSSIRENCEWVATIAALRGKRARWLSPDTRTAKTNWRITIAPNKGQRSSTQRSGLKHVTQVACPTVSSGYFMIRHQNTISVTGNSSVALIINYGYCNLTENYPEVENLLQVHDSLTGQCPIPLWPEMKPLIKKALEIPVPYDDPLIIPTSLKTSTVSWGDCKAEAWDD